LDGGNQRSASDISFENGACRRSKWVSLVRKTIPVVILMICFAGRARCETLTALPPNQQAVRSWTVSAVLQTFVLDGPVPLLGVEVAYHPIDRLAVAARLTTVLIAFDLAADVRYFVVPVQPRSGLYASIGGHLLAAFFGSGKGGSVELGYEKQLPGGVNVAASAGVTLLGLDSCGCGRPEQGTNWTWVPTVNLRMGRSF